MDTTLAMLQKLKDSNRLQSAYLHLCQRINEYQLSADKEGNVYCGQAQMRDGELLSILRRDIKNECPYLSNKAANFLCKATLQALIKNLHLMQESDSSPREQVEIDCSAVDDYLRLQRPQ